MSNMNELFEIGVKISDYELIEKIGDGNFASIYKAKDINNQFVALKLICKSYYEWDKFEIETKALSIIKNPFVIKFIESNYFDFKGNRYYYFVTELAKGGSLKDIIHSVSKNRALSILYDLLDALSELHKIGILHNDLKSENFLFKENSIKIIDFGITHITHQKENKGYIGGDYRYMAPEVLFDGVYSKQSDIWSMGVLMLQLLTNSKDSPFNSIQDFKSNDHIRELINSTDIEDSLKLVLINALNVNRRLRYAAANSFKKAIQSTIITSKEFINGKKNMRIEQGYIGWDYDEREYPSRKFEVHFKKPFKTTPIVQLSIIKIDTWASKENDKAIRYFCETKQINEHSCLIEISTWNGGKIAGAKIQWLAIGD